MLIRFADVQSPLLSPDDAATYLWEGANVTHETELTSYLRFSLFFAPLHHWQDVIVRASGSDALVAGGIPDFRHVAFDGGELQFHYRAGRFYDPKTEGLLRRITIESVAVRVCDAEAEARVRAQEQHRIVCQLSFFKGTTTYLGRAQQIVTSADQRRLYRWGAADGSSFCGIPLYGDAEWERRAMDAADLAQIQGRRCGMGLLTPRGQGDCDVYRNDHPILPIRIPEETRSVHIHFFNLRTPTPAHGECVISWKEIDARKTRRRRSRCVDGEIPAISEENLVFSEGIGGDLQVRIHIRPAEMEIYQIELLADKYRQTLAHLGLHAPPPKTV